MGMAQIQGMSSTVSFYIIINKYLLNGREGKERIILWMVLLLYLDWTELKKFGVCVGLAQWRVIFLLVDVSTDPTLINLICTLW